MVPLEGVDDTYKGRFELKGRSLRVHAARGVLINSAFHVGFAGLGLVQRLTVAAFLTASQFGIWGLLITTLMTLTWLKQIGITDKYIQQNERDQVAAFQKAFTLSLGWTLCFYVVVAAALPLYALVIYDRPDILVPGYILSASLLIGPFAMPIVITYRRMQFVRQRVLEGINPVVSLVVMVSLAVAGMSYWSLVIGTVAGSLAAALVAQATCPYPIRLRYERGTLKEYFSFSWPLFLNGVSRLLTVQGAVIVGNWSVGLAGLGAIGLAGQWASFVTRVDDIISRTMYPAVCAVADRSEVLFETFVKSNRIGLMWGLPFGIGLFLFAPDFVDHVLGERWEVAEPLLQAFGLVLALRQVAFNWTTYLRAVGYTLPIALDAFISLGTFLVVTMPLMLEIGLDGYVIGVSVDVVLSLALRSYFLSRLFAGFNLLKHMRRAFAPVIPPVAVVLAARLVEQGGDRTLQVAIGEFALYAVVAILAAWVFERRLLGEVFRYLRGGGRPAPEVAGGREALAR